MKAEDFKVHPLQVMGDCHDGYYVVYEDGYESWSPKDVFEKAYRACDEMTFGLAVEAVKKGQKSHVKAGTEKECLLSIRKVIRRGFRVISRLQKRGD